MIDREMPGDPEPFEKSAHYRLVCAALLLWWVGVTARSFSMDSISREAQAVAATEQGSVLNQLLIVALAALGLFHMPRAWQVLKSREGRNATILLLLYCAWSASSLLWSEDVSLSFRRYIAMVLLAVGCSGLGAGFYSRTSCGLMALARHVTYAGILSALILLPPRLYNLRLSDILNPAFNLKDNTEIAAVAYPAGYALLAAVVVFRWRVIARWAVIVFCMVTLVLLKGRSMMGEVVASGMILFSRLMPYGPARWLLAAAGMVQAGFYADLGTGGRLFINYVGGAMDALAPMLPWLTIGDGVKNLTSISGRVPLWTALYDYIGRQPLLGYGFGAFWTPEHLDEILNLANWHAVAAHNGFLDELLATGAIGLVLFLAFWIYAMALGVRLAREYDEALGHLLFAWLLLYLLFNALDSVNQAFFKAPFYISIAAIFASLQFFAEQSPVWVLERVPGEEAVRSQRLAA